MPLVRRRAPLAARIRAARSASPVLAGSVPAVRRGDSAE
ncbi:hypothetical protein BUC_3748 [Burkholderia pseudomallei 576]|nr:hypothetical protein BUC_3748 [Burkholderia pseudomallei 576]